MVPMGAEANGTLAVQGLGAKVNAVTQQSFLPRSNVVNIVNRRAGDQKLDSLAHVVNVKVISSEATNHFYCLAGFQLLHNVMQNVALPIAFIPPSVKIGKTHDSPINAMERTEINN